MGEGKASTGSPVRRSPIAGTWYPGQPEVLARSVRELLQVVPPPRFVGDLVGLVCPHAGLRYSGPVAAAGYRLLESFLFDTAVLVGPSHHVYFQGASVYARGAFETPLGQVKVDEELASGLQSRDRRLLFLVEAHDREHSLEMQLPFLQLLAPGMAIVPIVMGDQRRANVEAVAEAVAGVVAGFRRRVVLIASSDLSHYKSAEVAGRMDRKVATLVGACDPEGLMNLLERNNEHACGGGPMVAVLKAARSLGADAGQVLRYGDSGDVTGDKSEVVGYLAAAVFRKGEPSAGARSRPPTASEQT